MDLKSVLVQLRQERDALDAAISKLESLDRSRQSPERQPSLATKTASNGTNQNYSGPNSTSAQR
jgi:BMFP domain-containing protein YqiC